MSAIEVIRRLNIPELFNLADFSLDDADANGEGVYVSDSANGCVYKIENSAAVSERFSVGYPASDENPGGSINLAVASDSILYVADTDRELVTRYSHKGEFVSEFTVPGVLSLCHGPDGLIYALSNDEGIERISSYDQLGPVDTFAAPARYRAHLDATLVNLDSDPDGNLYVSYGMPPYRIWKVRAGGGEMETWGRALDYPEDAILIADIALDASSGVLWVLLACKEHGLQMLDAFNLDGEFLGTLSIPYSSNLYGVLCASEAGIYLLDTGSGDLVQASASL